MRHAYFKQENIITLRSRMYAMKSNLYFIQLWFICVFSFRGSFAKIFCHRIYVNQDDETKIPYVQLGGIYKLQSYHNGNFIFKHEQHQYFIENYKSTGVQEIVFTEQLKQKRNYAGLKGKMIEPMKHDKRHKNGQILMAGWNYYDWQSKSHVPVGANEISLKCVDDDVFRCTTARVFFNMSLVSSANGKVLHNYLTDYFEESTGPHNAHKNFRNTFRHSRQANWLLYYERPYWKVKNDKNVLYKPFLRVRDSSLRPEYITAAWEHFDGRKWKVLTNPIGIRCRGFMQKFANGSAKSCSISNPCMNGADCVNLKLTNETICRCPKQFSGIRCQHSQMQCSTYLHDVSTVTKVVQHGSFLSDYVSVFCKTFPKYVLSQCIARRHFTYWSYESQCEDDQTFARRSSNTQRVRRFTPDSLPFPLLFFIILGVILLQFVVPSIHSICFYKGKCHRLWSMYASIFFICWLAFCCVFLLVEFMKEETMQMALLIMGLAFIVIWYFFMLIESTFSAEREYLSSITPDMTVIQFIEQMRRAIPRRSMSISCYHMEQRTRTISSTDSHGHRTTSTETYHVPVTTYTESKEFPIASVVDVSNMASLNFDEHAVTRLKLTKNIDFADILTGEMYNDLKEKMIEENRHRDIHISFSCKDVIDGFKERLCAYTDPRSRPCWMKSSIFWLFTAFGLTWVFRLIFKMKTSKCDFELKKLISIIPRSEALQPIPIGIPCQEMMQLSSPSNPAYNNYNQGVDSMAMTSLSFQELDIIEPLPQKNESV